MSKLFTSVLKPSLVILFILSLTLWIFFVPWFIDITTNSSGNYFLKTVFMVVVGVSQLPLLVSFLQANHLLNAMVNNDEFSLTVVKRLKVVRYSGLFVIVLYVVILLVQMVVQPFELVLMVVSFIILFIATLITVMIYLLEVIFAKAFLIKSENDLTI